MAKKKKKGNNLLLNIMILICLGIFSFSGYKLISYYIEYRSMDEVYADLNKLVIENINLTPDDHGLLLRAPKIDMSKLKEINPDIVGFIIIPGTKISYPVLYNSDMNKYIDHDAKLNYSRAGGIFIDASNNPDFNDDNTIIYGHQMQDGSMFGDLTDYFRSEKFGKEHSFIYLYTENEVRLYRIYSGRTTDATSDVYTTYFKDKNEKINYINEQQNYSEITFSTTPNSDEPLILLSTCTNVTETGRYVIFAHLIEVIELS